MIEDLKIPKGLVFKGDAEAIALIRFPDGTYRYRYREINGVWWQVARDYKSRSSARRAALEGVCKKKVSHEKVS